MIPSIVIVNLNTCLLRSVNIVILNDKKVKEI